MTCLLAPTVYFLINLPPLHLCLPDGFDCPHTPPIITLWSEIIIHNVPVFRIRIRLDPFHERFLKRNRAGCQNHGKFPPNSQEYHTFFFSPKILNFCLTGIYIFLINNKTNHFLEKWIFDRKKGKKKRWYFLDFRSDPDPYQNKADPKHCYVQIDGSRGSKTVASVWFARFKMFFTSNYPLFRIQVRMDPFHFSLSDPGSKKSAKVLENYTQKINPNHKNIILKKKYTPVWQTQIINSF